jgi:pimeloyl-ACP methyl ester carboxylesterase
MKPVLVLLHGLLNDERVWQPVATRLADVAVLRIPNLRTQDSMAQMSRDAWAALADVPDDAALVLAGFSMGGYVAIQMLADAPRRVQALALIDTACRPEPADNVANREKTMAALQADFEGAALGLLRLGLHPDHLSNQALVDEGMRIMRAVGAAAGVRQLRAIVERADHRALLRRLDVPALVLCGRDDQVTPLQLSRDCAALMPDAELVIVENAGHWTPLEQPDAVAAALRALLARSG